MSLRRILVSAGEPSGDSHAAAVVRELRSRHPALKVRGFGGRRQEAAGADLVASFERRPAMGLVEVVRHLPEQLRILSDMGDEVRRGDYDLALLVDYPDFNLRLAQKAADAGCPVLYYVAPQIWAWRRRRVRLLRDYVEDLAVILPFEEHYFKSRGVRAHWVGHPLMEATAEISRDEARKVLRLPSDRKAIAVLPGSRPAEVSRHLDVFGRAVGMLRDRDVDCVGIVCAPPVGSKPEGLLRHDGDLAVLMAAADAAITKSGTVSLEAALSGVPMVIGYGMNPLSYGIARRLVSTRFIGLPNILLDEPVVPELVQRDLTAGAIVDRLEPLLDSGSAQRKLQLEAFDRIREMLSGPKASVGVADLAEQVAA